MSAAVPENQAVEESNGQESIEHGTYTFTNAEFFETAREMGYNVDEPVDDPEYNPNQVNTVEIGTANSGAIAPAAILDQNTVTLSQEVVNTVKDVGSSIGAAILSSLIPGGWAAAPTIAATIINEPTITNDLQITMVLQQTMNGSQWFATNYQWV